MGRVYGGCLGLLAFALMAIRGTLSGGGTEETLLVASAALFGFGAIGYVIGTLAEHLVNESVRTQFRAAVATWEQGEKEHKNQTK